MAKVDMTASGAQSALVIEREVLREIMAAIANTRRRTQTLKIRERSAADASLQALRNEATMHSRRVTDLRKLAASHES